MMNKKSGIYEKKLGMGILILLVMLLVCGFAHMQNEMGKAQQELLECDEAKVLANYCQARQAMDENNMSATILAKEYMDQISDEYQGSYYEEIRLYKQYVENVLEGYKQNIRTRQVQIEKKQQELAKFQ
ncbi:MAG: hypothetical protein PUC39_02455 [Lachnospiraceae bacterium]|nr:hypothetical protein [Lachnospiraceae bacterium]